LPIISEIHNSENIKESNDTVLILWDYATWNFSSVSELFSEIDSKELEWKKVFLWWWISSVADLDVLKNIWNISWFFVWSAIFDVNHKEFFEDYWEYKKSIF
jgi:hypothetical protein